MFVVQVAAPAAGCFHPHGAECDLLRASATLVSAVVQMKPDNIMTLISKSSERLEHTHSYRSIQANMYDHKTLKDEHTHTSGMELCSLGPVDIL